jgi:hypothetical protein
MPRWEARDKGFSKRARRADKARRCHQTLAEWAIAFYNYYELGRSEDEDEAAMQVAVGGLQLSPAQEETGLRLKH